MPAPVDVSKVRARLTGARSVLVLTGAGVSVGSGLSTYRGQAGSLYADPRRLQLAFGSALRREPQAFWDHWRERRRELRAAQPGPAHRALAALEARHPRLLLVTQNVDDLHRRAGSRAPLELHGNALHERCLDEACPQPVWPAPAEGDLPGVPLPVCPGCGAPARPDVVLFGEGAAPRWEPLQAFAAAGVELLLLVGTSGTVPVPEEVIRMVRAAGPCWVVDVNPAPSIPEVDATLVGPADELLPLLVTDDASAP